MDVCCGTGAIGLCLSKNAKKVIGVDIIEAAIENAKKNIDLNEGLLEKSKLEFYAGRAEDLLPSIVNKESLALQKDLSNVENGNKNITRIVGIVDPPRNGLHRDVLQALRTCKGLD